MCSQTKAKDRLRSPCLLQPGPAWSDQYLYLFFLHSTRRTYKRSHKFLKLVIQHFLPLHDLHRHHHHRHPHSPDRTSFALHSVHCGVSSLILVLSLRIRLLVSLVLTVALALVCHLVKNEMKWINVDSKSEWRSERATDERNEITKC